MPESNTQYDPSITAAYHQASLPPFLKKYSLAFDLRRGYLLLNMYTISKVDMLRNIILQDNGYNKGKKTCAVQVSLLWLLATFHIPIHITALQAQGFQSTSFPSPKLCHLGQGDLLGLGNTVIEMGYCTFLPLCCGLNARVLTEFIC